MSRLTMKEAAITSTVSHKWRKLWACYPGILNFEDSLTKEEWRARSNALVRQETCNFVRWVTHVVEQHKGRFIEEFKVIFCLEKDYQSYIDKWVVFALTKGAHSLVLDLQSKILRPIPNNFCSLALKCCIAALKSPYNMPSGLKTLVLCHINTSTEALECFLHSCPSLENLRLLCTLGFTSIRATSSPLALRHFELHGSHMEIIDIWAPKLLSFRYRGSITKLHLRNAFALSEVTVGDLQPDPLTYAFDSLSEYFSQLEYLSLATCLSPEINFVIPPVSNLTNLKHLKWTFLARCEHSILGWIPLIEASPALQKLTLELIFCNNWYCEMPGNQTSPRPLECLKTLEVTGFVGRRIDLELVMYVLENAVVLEEVIIDFKDCGILSLNDDLDHSRAAATEIENKLPQGARLVIKE